MIIHLVAVVATPAPGTVALEDCPTSVTWPPSLKVNWQWWTVIYSKLRYTDLETFKQQLGTLQGRKVRVHMYFRYLYNNMLLLNFSITVNDAVSVYLQILTVFVWNLTVFLTAAKIWRRECSFLFGCPSMRSTMSFCMTYWIFRPHCSPEKGSHWGWVMTSRATPMWKVKWIHQWKSLFVPIYILIHVFMCFT